MPEGPNASPLPSAAQIGRHFNLVSTASSTLLVLFVVAIVRSGAITGRPSIPRLADSLSDVTLGDAALVALAALGVGLALHPLQFAFVQFLEGYWGSGVLSAIAMETLAETHVRRYIALETRMNLGRALRRRLDAAASSASDPVDAIRYSRQRRRMIYLEERAEEALQTYPPDPLRILPTSLGNRLRSGEDRAGRAWGIDAVTAVPHLTLVADERCDAYFADTAADLDLAVRLCLIWSIASVIGTCFLWRDGLWLLLPAATYVLAYVSYRGAVIVADEHNVAIATLIDLNRFALYDRLGVERPETTRAERRLNRRLMRLLQGETDVSIEHPRKPPASTGT